jgi:hypothetical protein
LCAAAGHDGRPAVTAGKRGFFLIETKPALLFLSAMTLKAVFGEDRLDVADEGHGAARRGRRLPAGSKIGGGQQDEDKGAWRHCGTRMVCALKDNKPARAIQASFAAFGRPF